MAPRTKVETAQKPKVENATPQAPAQPARKVSAPKATIERPASAKTEAAPKAEPKKQAMPAKKPVVTSTTPPKPKIMAAPAAEPAPAPKAAAPQQAPAPKVAPKVAPAPAPTPAPEPELAPAAQAQQQAAAQAPAQAEEQKRTFSDAAASAKGWVGRTFPGHEHAFYGAIVAILVALLTFMIGFPRMLLICLLVLVGIAIGQYFDGDPKIIRSIRNLFYNDREQQ